MAQQETLTLLHNMSSIESIGAPSDEERKERMIDFVSNYMSTGQVDQLNGTSPAEATTSAKASENATQVSDVPKEIQGAGDGFPDAQGNTKITDEESKKAPPVENIISSGDIDGVIKDIDLFQDSDGDGIIDKLDTSGDESQIEQMYDKAAEGASEENVRSFISLMAMFSNLDLTKMNQYLVSGDSQSLAVQATAGCAQVAIMHSCNLQTQTDFLAATHNDVKKMLQNFQGQDNQLKLKNLNTLANLVGSLPKAEDAKKLLQDHPGFKKLPPEKQNALINRFADNLACLKEMKKVLTPNT